MPLDFTAQRLTMVDSQIRPNDVPSLAIQKAMLSVPREALLGPDQAYLAYADAEVTYAPGRMLMRPREVGKLLYALKPQAGERALAIAAPYAAAVLEVLGVSVIRQDADPDAVIDGHYDLIVCEGAVSAPPPAWLGALAAEGRLGVVVRDGRVGRAMLYRKTDDGIGARAVFDAAPPVMPGFEANAGFVF